MMAQSKPADEPSAPAFLDINQDLAFQRAEWSVQRLGWLVMTVLVILALVGLTGAGPLATAQVSDPGNALRVEYSRFERVQAATEVQIELAATGRDPVELWIANEYLNAVELSFISPNPVETRTGADRQVFAFAPIEGATSIVVGLEFRPKAAGMLSATMGIPNGGEVAFRQFVYP
jgi:hypothetical protein